MDPLPKWYDLDDPELVAELDQNRAKVLEAIGEGKNYIVLLPDTDECYSSIPAGQSLEVAIDYVHTLQFHCLFHTMELGLEEPNG